MFGIVIVLVYGFAGFVFRVSAYALSCGVALMFVCR